MTVQSVVDNCDRLFLFFKDTAKYDLQQIIANATPKGLVELYGRALDFHGAPASYMSRLYLTGPDYDEFVEWAKEAEGFHVIEWPNKIAIGFNYVGYRWIVENK